MEVQSSSKTVKYLLENEVFNFWSKDWSKLLIIDWSSKCKRDCFFNEVREKLGSGFHFERSLSGDSIDFIATENGLTPSPIH